MKILCSDVTVLKLFHVFVWSFCQFWITIFLNIFSLFIMHACQCSMGPPFTVLFTSCCFFHANYFHQSLFICYHPLTPKLTKTSIITLYVFDYLLNYNKSVYEYQYIVSWIVQVVLCAVFITR